MGIVSQKTITIHKFNIQLINGDEPESTNVSIETSKAYSQDVVEDLAISMAGLLLNNPEIIRISESEFLYEKLA